MGERKRRRKSYRGEDGAEEGVVAVEDEERLVVGEEQSVFARTLQGLVLKSAEEEQARPEEVVLSQRRTKEMKELEKEKREAKEAKKRRIEKRKAMEQGLTHPRNADPVFEKELKKVATRGVVMLFNAIQDQQQVRHCKQQQERSEIKEVSKDNFLQVLKGKATGKWDVLNDGLGIEEGAEVEDEEQEAEEEDENE